MKDIQAFSCRCVSCLGRLDMLPRFWWTARSKSLRSSRQRSGESFFWNEIFGSILEITQFFCHQVVGMEEGESDYSVVHLGPETQGLPAFHRIVGEDEVTGISLSSFDWIWFLLFMIHLQSETRQYCSLEAMEPVTSTSIWNPTVSQAITSPLYEIQVRLCNQVLSQEDYLVCSKNKR